MRPQWVVKVVVRPACPAIGGVKVATKRGIKMNLDYVINLGREAIFLTLIISAPVLLFSFIVGLFMSIFQASTQIQETGLNFIPKLLAVALALVLFLPWMLQKLIDFATELFEYIPFLTR